MYYLYILLGIKSPRSYTGVSDDVTRRLSEHNSGKVISSRPYRPYRLIHTEAFETLSEARKRERYYKTFSGRRQLKKIFAKSSAEHPSIS